MRHTTPANDEQSQVLCRKRTERQANESRNATTSGGDDFVLISSEDISLDISGYLCCRQALLHGVMGVLAGCTMVNQNTNDPTSHCMMAKMLCHTKPHAGFLINTEMFCFGLCVLTKKQTQGDFGTQNIWQSTCSDL